jgi:branched-chain amino acid transport system substrate-binding protein
MNRRKVLGWATAAIVFGLTSVASAEEPPIKIGMSMPQTGGLAGGGKPSLLGIEIWRDDVNAKGGLLGRKVELVVYDDKSSASETPALYAKLLDVDKADRPDHAAGEAARPAADGEFLLPGEQQDPS